MSDSSLNDRIEAAASTSKSLTAIIGLVSGLVGILLGAFGAAFYVRDELQAWQQIKTVHENNTLRSEVVVYDHTDLDPVAIKAIATALNLPEFSKFALKTDVPASVPTGLDLDVEELRQQWDENEVFVTFNDLEYEFTKVGLLEGDARLDGAALPMVVRLDSDIVKYGDPVRVKFVGSSTDLYLTSGKQRAGGDTYEVTNDAGSSTRWELIK